MLTDSVKFFGRHFADACVRTGDDGGLAVQPGRAHALTAEHRGRVVRLADDKI